MLHTILGLSTWTRKPSHSTQSTKPKWTTGQYDTLGNKRMPTPKPIGFQSSDSLPL